MTNNTFDTIPRADTNQPDPWSGYSKWQLAPMDIPMDILNIRREWMRMMGMDEDEIEEHCRECPPVDLDEELAQYNAMYEVDKINSQ